MPAVIIDPNLALILLVVGTWGVFFELARPGAVLPGVAGALCLVLGFLGLQMLPFNGAGVSLVVIGSAFLLAEALFPSHGGFGLGGLIAIAAGTMMLFDAGGSALGLRPGQLAGFAFAAAAALLLLLGAALRSRNLPQVGGGRDELIGSVARVETWDGAGTGWVRLQGELWRARSVVPLDVQQLVRVIGVDGLLLQVGPEGEPQGGRG